MIRLLQISSTLLLVVSHVISEEDNDCKINVETDMRPESPLILCKVNGTSHKHFCYPPSKDPKYLRFKENDNVTFACPRHYNSGELTDSVLMRGESIINERVREFVTLKCAGSNKFRIDDEDLEYTELSCNPRPRPYFHDHSSNYCKKGHSFKAYFNYADNETFEALLMCVDDDARTVSIFSEITNRADDVVPMRVSSGLVTKSPTLDDYSTNHMTNIFENVNMHSGGPYSSESQEETFQNIRAAGFLQKCVATPLISHEDKFYPFEKELTYHMANLVPLWEGVKEQAWLPLEKYIHKLVNRDINKTFEVFAGTIGTAEFDGEPLYLIKSTEAGKGKIPVPKFVYKCLMETTDQIGICFLVFNDHDRSLLPWREVCPEFHKYMDKLQLEDERVILACDPFSFNQTYGVDLGAKSWEWFAKYRPLNLEGIDFP